ncbi:hypothetical protein LN042_08325 [Kitasatospora sp. RB6PN24]|uniref:hypothetical protein n=1 Tax=Kitasatospora humi TaxID=2893891 RepID=UPI001E4AFC20|nr:hypothetical protein [Kitasatospora humi]MCC9307110.1 hypothetical protein [Kitasatospora humi]
MMDAASFLAEVIATGTIVGVRLGSSLHDVDQVLNISFAEEVDETGIGYLRRDYGLIELSFSGGPNWACDGILVEVHRLAQQQDLIDEWRDVYNVKLARYASWENVRKILAVRYHLTDMEIVEQGGDVSFRSSSPRFAVVVMPPGCRRGEWPGGGDIVSIDIF